MSDEKYYIATLCAVKNFGNSRVRRLIDFFGSAENAWNSTFDDLKNSGLPNIAVQAFREFRALNPNAPEKLIGYCNKNKIGLCSIADDDYPPLLKTIPFPPVVFYYLGKIQPAAERIAVVGCRDNTPYGERAATEISESLARAGITVVSGVAKGIDTFAHMGAMKYGRTVAVVGCGIEYAFSNHNENLIRQIADNGLVLSIFPPSQTPNRGTFPARNRIIAGLSKAMIAVEAAITGGTVIACNYALDFGRNLFAVPGSIFSPKSVGCNNFLRNGAMLIQNANDVLSFYAG